MNDNARICMMAALSLGKLGDASAIPDLNDMAQNDPHHYGRGQAEAAIKKFQERAKVEG